MTAADYVELVDQYGSTPAMILELIRLAWAEDDRDVEINFEADTISLR